MSDDPPVFNQRHGSGFRTLDGSLKARMRRHADDQTARREAKIAHALWEINRDAHESFRDRQL